VLTTGKAAFQFALQRRELLFPAATLVFSGIRDFDSTLTAGVTRVTGVVDVLQPKQIMALALQLHPGVRRILVVHDETAVGRQTREAVETLAREFTARTAIQFSAPTTLTGLAETVERLPPNSVVFIGHLEQDRAGNFCDPATIMAWMRPHNRLPIYFLHATTLGKGAVGGALVSGRLQGAYAAMLAMRILNGTDVAALPVARADFTRIVLDYDQLRRFGVNLDQVPANCILLNKASRIQNEHLRLLWGAVCVVAILGLLALILVMNIIERRRVERALRQTQFAVDHAAISVFWINQEGRYIYVNDAACRMLGFAREELLKMDVHAIDRGFPPERWQEHWRLLQEQGSLAVESNYRGKDGHIYPVEISSNYIEFDGQGYTCAFARDITERKQSEDRLIRSQKMEAIGQLAGGVAHDFNNLLTGILGYATVIEREVLPGSAVQEAAKTITKASERAAELTKQLLDFARRGERLNVPLDMNAIIGEVTALLSRTLDKSIRITSTLYGGGATVMGDPGQLHQVLLNLAVNARDAMPDGGDLIFESGIVCLDKEYCRFHADTMPGPYVLVSVRDTGCGIPKDMQQRIFEPYFTTKPKGKGTGMGLATAYGIIKNHGGFIEVYSEPQAGAVFRIYLPYSPQKDLKPPHAIDVPSTPLHGTGRILLIDDEQIIRDLATNLLQELGYEVVTAVNGQEAVAFYREHYAAIHLVIVDMAMPEMNGRECYHALKEINPAVRALLSSGYGRNERAEELIGEGMLGFVQKPFNLNELAAAVAAALRMS
jgi:PAS domain S-box-containing protein